MDPIFAQLLQPAGIVGTLACIALVAVWREWRLEAKEKDKLYERHTKELSKVVAQHHEFAHTLQQFVEAEKERARAFIEDARRGE